MRRPYCLCAWLAASTLLAVSPGCTPENMFYGRIIVFNNSGAAIRDLRFDYRMIHDKEVELPKAGTWTVNMGEAGAIDGGFVLSWSTAKGEARGATIPFPDIVPNGCKDDLLLEINHAGDVASSLARSIQRTHSSAATVTSQVSTR